MTVPPLERSKRRLLAIGALTLVAIVAARLASRSDLGRFANLKVPENGFASTYVLIEESGRGKRCVLTDRGGTTATRSEAGLPTSKWDYLELGPKKQVFAAIASKRPAYLFVPFTLVTDLDFPYFHALARAEGASNLPRIRWAHLYRNRQFAGLYLQVSLPNRDYTDKRGLGDAELLVVRENQIVCLDRKLRGVCPLLSDRIALGVHPAPRSGGVDEELAGLLPEGEASFFLASGDADHVHWLPVPVALYDLLASHGASYSDDRVAAWVPGVARSDSTDLAVLQAGSEQELATYHEALKKSIVASCEVMHCDAAQYLAALRTS